MLAGVRCGVMTECELAEVLCSVTTATGCVMTEYAVV